QKTYNGVATISRQAVDKVITDLPGLEDPQRRVLASTIGSTRILNVYIPNGQAVGSEKFSYKLNWLEMLVDYVRSELTRHERLVLLGDFNIAPTDEDVHDPKQWEGKVLCSEPERGMFRRLIELGLDDAFRKFDQAPNSYSWWDYRAGAFRRNIGLRIDHILCSDVLYASCMSCGIDTAPRRLDRPSDHAPVIAEFETAS
ncbi:MAG: exodeoxyribonuclease III, partial [Gammaproteobacteria bacterium]|nr:exodeoxyribonuclease III [Gammaproteobacteria bacterium]